MKILDTMVMHNGTAGITVGVIVLDVRGVLMVFGTIAAAKTGMDEWQRKIGYNMATGRLNKFTSLASTLSIEEALAACNVKFGHQDSQTIFKMGEFGGQSIRKNLFHPIRDIVRNARPRRSILSIKNKLIRLVSPGMKLPPNFIFAGADDCGEDDGMVIPRFASRGAACAAQPAPASIASPTTVDDEDFVHSNEFDLGGEC